MPDWRTEVLEAVQRWLAKEGQGGSPRWEAIAAARPGAEQGWFTVDLRGRRGSLELFEALRIGPAGLKYPERDAHPVGEVVVEGEIARVRAGSFLDGELCLYGLVQPRGFLIQRLLEALRGLTDPGKADDLARGRLTTLPPLPTDRDRTLNPAQWQVYDACHTPGLFLVWGPPGTGKTRVLALAITSLLQAGSRVLLVSPTNVAVDNALLEVVKSGQFGPGELVRVGPPALPDVAKNPSVSLPLLVKDRQRKVAEERDEVERRLSVLQDSVAKLRRLEDELAGYDPHAYETARRLIDQEQQIAESTAWLERLGTELEQARMTAEAKHRELARAEAAWEEIAPARQYLAEAGELRAQLNGLEIEAGKRELALMQADSAYQEALAKVRALESQPLLARLRNRVAARNARETRDTRHRELEAAARRYEEARKALERQRPLLQARIPELLQRAAPIDEAEIARREKVLDEARAGADTAKGEVAALERQRDDLRRKLETMRAGPRATDEHHRVVAEAEQANFPTRHAELERLRQHVKAEEPQRQRLEARYRELGEKLERLRRDAEKEIIGQAKLVAATLARSRIHPAIAAREFDVVLVDEAGAATVPEVLLAVAKAERTAVLLGDFLQLPAPTASDFRQDDNLRARDWLGRDCFEVCGIRTPQDARDHPGCAVLTWQYRFGPAIMQLANRAMYAGELQPGRELPALDPADPEIVFLDTDKLDDLGTIRRISRDSGWWPAGGLLGRILAQHHRDRGESVAILAPYRYQVEVALEALRDVEDVRASLDAEALTIHSAQGCEFDVVIFDLVEDGRRPGWVAKGRADSTNGYRRDGARLFNVGLTRAKHRLYLIGSGKAVRRAPSGTVLHTVRKLVREGLIRRVAATELLAPAGAEPAAQPDPVTLELADVLSQYVRIVEVLDERTFYAALEAYLGAARQEIYLWAPWTAKRTHQVLPLLSDAVRRGVDVRVFVRGSTDRQMQERKDFREALAALRQAVPRVIRYRDMHQKLIVIDRRVTVLGSLNILSHSTTREVMCIVEGHRFAAKMLEHEHGEAFSTPPGRCGDCGHPEVELWRSKESKMNYPWFWRCGRRDERGRQACAWRQEVRLRRERNSGT
ncbi:hypothetical protein TH66_05985 [Carbonactinospora thermoautotrophica]|uniref:PLD phosphodiesterase domain-containing protein n=1 Tax=Carbonactinospora thermoautotrophica TaxID=1469144 RepID=A0A132N588_9ACTN|nr:AAA domain-containing protein [Carbonactinospora thermoautotrophica]KWX04742.1 hypothetical protein TH66_05985 [Carbonactinospora thermoautotrophica]KWX08960.1 hypothetical protein TR74_12505 [Carbonactinospora thermoautotrophica]